MSKITWLHLSDLHFKPAISWDQNVVLRALLEDVKERINSENLSPDFVVVTGDIAFGGAPEEYDLARGFFDNLLEVVHLTKERLLIVPGNHDVNREAITPGAKAIATSLNSPDAIGEMLCTDVDRRLIFRKFNHYAEFMNDYFGEELYFGEERYFYVKLFKGAGRQVAVLGLNSAWLSIDDEDRGRLALGEHQVREALMASREADLKIALLHHPFDWLQESDRNDCEAVLMQKCDFILHGHLHRTGLMNLSMPDAGSMIIAAGACYETREYPNSYNFVQINVETREGNVYLRRYSDERGGFWTKDVMTYRNVDNGVYTFQFPAVKDIIQERMEPEPTQVPMREEIDPLALEEAYLRRLKVVCNALPLAVIDPRAVERTRQQTMDLSSVYVGLNTRSRVEPDSTVIPDTGKRLRKDGALKLEEEARQMTALEAADRERQMVLLGDPGSGKSTFANFLALCLAGESLEKDNTWLERLKPMWTHGPLLPLKVALREFAASNHCAGTAAGLWDFIVSTLALDGLADFGYLLRERLLAGAVMVILDGLDEVADPKERMAVRDAVTEFCTTYGSPDNRYLVTCRGYAYQDPKWQLNDFPVHTLAPLNKEQVDELITCWYEEVRRLGWKSETEAKDLTRRLQAAAGRKDLLPLAINPLQLTMMASLHFSWGRLPDDRAELYQEMVRLLLVRWQEARLGEDVGVTRMVSAGKLESALERVAFIAHRAQESFEGPADIMESQLRSVLKDCLEGSWDSAGELLTYIKERAGLLIERSPGIYTFPHRSYQEYLAGSYLALQADFPDQTAGLIHGNYLQWREVVLWAVGIMARLKRMTHVSVDVASALCPPESPGMDAVDEEWRAAHLAGEALLEIGLEEVRTRRRFEQVQMRVQEWLIALIGRGELTPADRTSAGNSLANLGDTRFLEDAWFLPDDPLLGFVEVPEGPFLMGSDKDKDKEAYEDEIKQHEVKLPTYYMARYPVTVAQFRAFVNTAHYEPTNSDCLEGIENHPVVDVTWRDAMAYCDWLTERLREWDKIPEPLATLLREGEQGGHPWRITLPSEAEWEKAARGEDGRIYPWGNDIDTNRANYDETGINTTSAVGCFPAGGSPYGCMDMAGNVWEWTRSLWGKDIGKPDFRYPYDPRDGREDLKAGDDVRRVLRGGGFDDLDDFVRCAIRGWGGPGGWSGGGGFRVVLSSFFSEP